MHSSNNCLKYKPMKTIQILLTIELAHGKRQDSETLAKTIEQRAYNYITSKGATVEKCAAVVVPESDGV
jgi:hypothetical protein